MGGSWRVTCFGSFLPVNTFNINREPSWGLIALITHNLAATCEFSRPACSLDCHLIVAVSLPGLLVAPGAAVRHLGEIGPTLNGVDEDVARLEHGVRGPGPGHFGLAAAGQVVVVWVDVEVGDLADAVAGGVPRDGRDVVDAEAGAVVGLVGVAVLDVLVVVGRGDSACLAVSIYLLCISL